ncbi:MAG: precorrin-2 C(20)-methyltransferase [Boseongicola sp. SB0667_bin_21]|nr:precorrin-2 C(20)-methyltransferase [Boseongicola sp.]MXW84587.1 precorrin-2 C(20)-methyltransferase [Boseongicola sp. SB0667_bin_21]
MTGTVYGVGLGPGEPDLMSAKALKLLARARHVAFFRKKGRTGRARTLAGDLVPADAVEFAMEYPLTTEVPLEDPRYNRTLAEFYDGCAAHVATIAAGGEDVVVLCEGDPFFYGSFMHLHERVIARAPVEVVPGIPGMAAAWAASGVPIAWGDDVLSVLMGTLDEDVLVRHMEAADALVVMKVGRNLSKVRAALERAGRAQDAWVIECAAMADQKVTRLAEVPEGHVPPYFTIVLVHGQGRRP